MTDRATSDRLAYHPWDPSVIQDPYPYYERLRAEGGCHEVPST